MSHLGPAQHQHQQPAGHPQVSWHLWLAAPNEQLWEAACAVSILFKSVAHAHPLAITQQRSQRPGRPKGVLKAAQLAPGFLAWAPAPHLTPLVLCPLHTGTRYTVGQAGQEGQARREVAPPAGTATGAGARDSQGPHSSTRSWGREREEQEGSDYFQVT